MSELQVEKAADEFDLILEGIITNKDEMREALK